MPSHPPDNAFYQENNENYTLWRDLSRLFEDFCGPDPAKWPVRREQFQQVLADITIRLNNAHINH